MIRTEVNLKVKTSNHLKKNPRAVNLMIRIKKKIPKVIAKKIHKRKILKPEANLKVKMIEVSLQPKTHLPLIKIKVKARGKEEKKKLKTIKVTNRNLERKKNRNLGRTKNLKTEAEVKVLIRRKMRNLRIRIGVKVQTKRRMKNHRIKVGGRVQIRRRMIQNQKCL